MTEAFAAGRRSRVRRARRTSATLAVAAFTTTAAASWTFPHVTASVRLVADHDLIRYCGFILAVVVFAVVAFLVNLLRQRARRPLFEWEVLNEECQHEFMISGPRRDTVEKSCDYNMHGWVIPVNGTRCFTAGRLYRWSFVLEQVNKERPEIQFGIQGMNFEYPWRLVTTTRCSRSRDDEEQWLSRPEGDQRIEENDVIHLELDFSREPGVLRMALNSLPFETVFDDIPTGKPVMPALMLGGHGSRVRVQAASRRS